MIRKRRGEKGSAIVAAIIFSGVVLVIAGALLNMVLNRNLVFSGARGHQYSQIAEASALNELNGCLYSLPSWPPASPPNCPNWACTTAGCSKSVTQGSFSYALTATWTATSLSVVATPQ